MSELVPQPYQQKAGKIRELLSTYRKAEDMVNIGAYVKGSNPKIDMALKKIDPINSFLIQRYDEKVGLENAFGGVEDLTKDC
jgi:flagellum-specific ATP synthase